MTFYIRKIISFIITLLLVSIVTFFVFQILPGDPATVILGPDADPYQIEVLRQELGLNASMASRYISWIKNALAGNLGISMRYHLNVSDLIASRLPITLSLAVVSLILTILIGIPLGIYCANEKAGVLAKLINVLSSIFMSIPSFWIGMILILLFSIVLEIFPSGDYIPIEKGIFEWLSHLFLPGLSIALGNAAVLTRYLKVSIHTELKNPYVVTAISKGLSTKKVLYLHVLRNAFIPTITLLGLITVDILGGSIITENVFNLPGLGQLIVASINSRDLPLIQGLVLYLATLVISFNFLVDFLYTLIDPRVRLR